MNHLHRIVGAVSIASLLGLAGCGGGSGSNSSSSSPSNNATITVTVSPASAIVAPGATQQYNATVSGTSNGAVTWSAGGVAGGNATVGTINSSGLYTAPAAAPSPSTVSITATSVANTSASGSAQANVQVHHDNQDAQSGAIRLGTSGGNATAKNTSNNHIFCCSGTLGALVSRGNNLYILSNNHVLDKSDQGANGDPISQPGLADSNCGQNGTRTVANLSQSAQLTTSNVDAAMAQIVPGQVDTSGSILDLAAPGQAAPPSATLAAPGVGQPVAKSGDATGLTCSTVSATNVDVRVNYSTQCQGGSTFNVVFHNQVAVNGAAFSNSGDSGSLIVTSDTARPVALLYAGSDTGSIGNPLQDVLTALKDPSSSAMPMVVGGADHAVQCPASPQAAAKAQTRALNRTEVNRAESVRATHAAELLSDPAVARVSVGQSMDSPSEPAIVIELRGEEQRAIPTSIDGVRTQILRKGLQQLNKDSLTQAREIKDRQSEEWMAKPAIVGLGVGQSEDDPSASAVVVFVDSNQTLTLPQEIDGIRTKIIATEPFRSYNWGKTVVHGCTRR